MTFGMWFTVAIWFGIFGVLAYHGYHVDKVILPAYLVIMWVLALSGYGFGYGIRCLQYWINILK
jgi:hypothetical protein